MANTNRYGQEPLICIAQEDEYGTAADTPTNKYADMFLCKHSHERVHIPMHTQTIEPQIQTERIGRNKFLTTISGVLNDDYQWLLNAFFLADDTPYTFPTDGDGDYSYTLWQIFPGTSEGCQAEGAVLQRLVITRNGGYIGFTADFICKAADWEVDLSELVLTTITDLTLPTHTPFMFHDITCSLLADNTALNNFTLTLEKELVPDDNMYQNSDEIALPYAQGYKATLDVETHYGSENDQEAYDNIYSQTPGAAEIAIINEDYTWTIAISGQYTAHEIPDIEKGIYTGKFSIEAMGSSGTNAIEITVAET